jgi:TIR domain
MNSVFISHASKDRYFVNLLVALLKFHEVKTWWSDYDIEPGTRFRTLIQEGLHHAESLIVVVSQHAAVSKWVTAELATFLEKRPDARVIPLLLDRTNPDDVIDRLTDFQALSFTDDMLVGFEKLTEIYGKKFLPRVERRNKDSRRNPTERRVISAKDRRRSPLIQRMRKGFWKAFEDRYGTGKFSPIPFSVSQMLRTIEGLAEEAARYSYRQPDGTYTAPDIVVKEVITHIWDEYRPKHQMEAIFVIEMIAEQMHAAYEVSQSDRRLLMTRRESGDRRERES